MLKISTGQHSDKGRKTENQDFFGLSIPTNYTLQSKGIAIAIADGISSSEVGHIASETAIKNFLTDYYCTPQAWSVKRSAQRVINASNAWLYAQSQRSHARFDKNLGYVTTFSALILKSCTAYLFHIGDSRIYHLDREGHLEQLTTDHRTWITEDENYLSKALGVQSQLELEYQERPVNLGDLFILATDGVYEYLSAEIINDTLASFGDDLDGAAKHLVGLAFENGSKDNLTIQLIRVDGLPDVDLSEISIGTVEKPILLDVKVGQVVDDFEIIKELHSSHRSHLYLAIDRRTGSYLVIKTLTNDNKDTKDSLERLLVEEWVARRLSSPYLLKTFEPVREKSFVYSALEYIDGVTLWQWMRDNPRTSLLEVRRIVTQIGKALQAMHRMEMIHQDLRPENIMISKNGVVKIIDFGATRLRNSSTVGGFEMNEEMLGTVQYSAPEYIVGEESASQSDIYSLGVIVYQMLSGALPFGTKAARVKNVMDIERLKYRPLSQEGVHIPDWVESAIEKSVHLNPRKRYAEVSEFVWDLHNPNSAFSRAVRKGLIEKDPLMFWRLLSLILMIALIVAIGVR